MSSSLKRRTAKRVRKHKVSEIRTRVYLNANALSLHIWLALGGCAISPFPHYIPRHMWALVPDG